MRKFAAVGFWYDGDCIRRTFRKPSVNLRASMAKIPANIAPNLLSGAFREVEEAIKFDTIFQISINA